MTAYGPPPGPPQGAPYGAPQGPQNGPQRTGVDPKTVNPLDWGILGAGLLALIFSFFSYYNYAPKGASNISDCKQAASQGYGGGDVCDGIGNSAWHGFFGWFGVLLVLIAAIAVAIAVFAPAVQSPVPLRLVALGATALGVVSTLLAVFIVPDGSYNGQTIDSGSSDVDAGHGFSYWIVLILVVIALVLAFLRFQQTGGQLSGRMATGPAQSGYGYPQQPAQQGYPQQAPQQGYVPPQPQGPLAQQGPPAGYGQQPPAQGPPAGYGQQPPAQDPPAGYAPPPPAQGPPPGYGQQPPAPPQGYGPSAGQ
ncbi:MAG: hypothetical protein ABI368_12205 [Jatrophihabitantaceae bacterium]